MPTGGGVDVGEVDAVDRDAAVVGPQQPERDLERRGLADAARAGQRDDRAGPQHQVEAVRRAAARGPDRHVVERRVAVRRSGAVRVPAAGTGSPAPRTPVRRRDPVGRGVELDADLAQRQEDLGRQDEHRDPGDQVEVPSTSRSPMPTATSATDSVVSSSSTMDDRNAIRSVPMVARRCASPSVRTRAPGPRSRPSARGSAGRRAGRAPGRRAAACWPGRSDALREPPDQDHEQRDQRQHDDEDRRGHPVEPTRRAGGPASRRREQELRQVPHEVGLELSSPRVASVTTAASSEATARPSATARHHGVAQVGDVRVAARWAKRSCTGGPRGPDRDDGREPRDRRAQASSVRSSARRRPGGASSSACATTRAAVSTPSPAVRRRTGGRPARAGAAAGREASRLAGALRAATLSKSDRWARGCGPRRSAGGTPSTSSPGRADERRQERGDPGHDAERVGGRRRVGEGQRVGRSNAGITSGNMEPKISTTAATITTADA